MKKIISIVVSFILLIIINGWAGYEPIFGSKNLKFKIANHSVEGNKILGNTIYSKLFNLSESENSENLRSINLYINVSKIKSPTSKNNAGKILEYKVIVNTKVKIEDDLTGDVILNQSFEKSVNFKVQDQHSKTLSLENQSVENLINNIYQDLLINFTNKLET